MKRLIIITCSFLLLFADVASAWASCKKASFASNKHYSSATPAHKHEHHSSSDHNHSHDAGIHCPNLNEFLPVATFSTSKNDRVQRLLDMSVAPLDSQPSQYQYRSIHGPPGFAYLSFIPPYLSLSVLRI
jgi:hypothetical protein